MYKHSDEIKDFIRRYKNIFTENIYQTEGNIEEIALLLKDNNLKNIFFIGNGASAAIASHSAADYAKTGKLKTRTFTDDSLITAISNDYGYDKSFSGPLEIYGNMGDILFAISSSGESKNILNAVKFALRHEIQVITLTGFDYNNSLRKLGNYNFYVPSHKYGIVESTHQFICHLILDTFMFMEE